MSQVDPSIIKGQLFRPGAGSGSAVDLRLAAGGGSLEAVGESVSYSFPLATCGFEVGGYEDSMLVITHQVEPGSAWVVYAPRTPARVLLGTSGVAPVRQALADCDRVYVGRKGRGLVVGGAVLATCLAGIWALSLLVDGVLWMGAGWIPVAWEVGFGRTAVESMYPKSACLEDPEVVAAVDQIVARLLAATETQGYEFQVRVAREDTVNAFAVPGGQLVVLTGLLAKAESPEEVAGVLAHEVQHVLHRHSLRKMMAYVKWQIALSLLLGDLQTVAEMLMAQASKLMVLAYDRDMEREADYDGLELLHRAGIDPKGMVEFFARLAREEGMLEGKLVLISTHPGSAARAAELERRIAATPGFSPRPFDFDWKHIQQRLKEANP